MLGRRFLPFLKRTQPASPASALAEEGTEKPRKTWGRRVVSGALICLTGGVALSALDDLAIYHACSSKAMEKASKNQAIVSAIGEPIERGPWYNASLALAHKRHSVSCTFPVSAPQGTGIFRLKAVRNGEDTIFSFLRPRDWDVIVLDALLHVPGNDDKKQTVQISVSDYPPAPAAPARTTCPIPTPQPQESADKALGTCPIPTPQPQQSTDKTPER